MEMVLVSEVHALRYSKDNRQAFCFLDKNSQPLSWAGVHLGAAYWETCQAPGQVIEKG